MVAAYLYSPYVGTSDRTKTSQANIKVMPPRADNEMLIVCYVSHVPTDTGNLPAWERAR